MTDEVFDALSHPLRIKILRILSSKPIGFADLKRRLKIDSSGQLDFHLKKMDHLLQTTNHGLYTLNSQGFSALTAVGVVSRYGWQRRSLAINIGVFIIMNAWMVFLLAQGIPFVLYLLVVIPLTCWMAFYAYWSIMKRKVLVKDDPDEVETQKLEGK